MHWAPKEHAAWIYGWLLFHAAASNAMAAPPAITPSPIASHDQRLVHDFVGRHCIACHNADDKAGELDLAAASNGDIIQQPHLWEKVVRRLSARQMPPSDMPRPDEADYEAILTTITGVLDRRAAGEPNPGRTLALRRLTRTEYQNAIRDLLAIDIDASELLPIDEVSHGFDNITVGDLSPTLLDRYLTAAQKIGRLAVASPLRSPAGDTIRLRADLTQEEHVEGLPLGTRGGALVPYTFPQSGEYEIQLRLARDRNEHVEGLTEPHELEVLLDRQPMASFKIKPPRGPQGHQTADQHLKARFQVAAGPHQLGVTFLKKPSSLLETKRQPYQAHFNMHRHPRISPALYQVSITGPYSASGTADTPARRRLFVCQPKDAADEESCARRILTTLMQRAYRRPVAEDDVRKPLAMFREARAAGGFDAGIEMAVSSVLVNPNFLLRIERDPPGAAPQSVYKISDLELASRLSFFLWSSIPDDELLELAIDGRLSEPDILQQQVRRLLADPRSESLVTNFAAQWLHLRNLDSITPDLRLFPDFDDNLRQAFRRETELLLQSVVREDRSVLELLKSDHTWLNERLAKHYGVPHVYGSRFRRVELDGDSHRGGLLRQGSILTVTSYATRTSPVIRGKWILENLLGTPPPPPPPNVPALKDNTVSSMLSVRQRLAEHRANVACASCHKLMDPVGFALENFDAVGRWRETEEGQPIDATGGLPDGSEFAGVDGLEKALLQRPELFVRTLTEKLLTFALGRGVEPFDAPAIRRLVREAERDDYRLSSIVVGIANSTPFQMRRAE
jgi:mono/diheme cytochrome c family protein